MVVGTRLAGAGAAVSTSASWRRFVGRRRRTGSGRDAEGVVPNSLHFLTFLVMTKVVEN